MCAPCNAAVFGIRTTPRPRRAHTSRIGDASAAGAPELAPIPLSHNIVRSRLSWTCLIGFQGRVRPWAINCRTQTAFLPFQTCTVRKQTCEPRAKARVAAGRAAGRREDPRLW